ncbi:MAG: hypothetical protein LBH38_00515, partial [Holosporales bacterium]|nr:hypothetical protein [Holosporales bacterium]
MPTGITALSELSLGNTPFPMGRTNAASHRGFEKFLTPEADEADLAKHGLKGVIKKMETEGQKSPFAMTSECLLTLLITQLKYQDPLNPMNGTEFVNQMGLLSDVQQSAEMNAKLSKLIEHISVTEAMNAAHLVGQTIETPGQWFEVGEQNAFELSFDAPENLSEATVIVFNEDGIPVRTLPAASHPLMEDNKVVGLIADVPSPGKQKIVFDWKDEKTPYTPGIFNGKNDNGEPLESGVYRFMVVGKYPDGQTVASKELPTYVRSKVTSTTRENGKILALLGRVPVLFREVEGFSEGIYESFFRETGQEEPGAERLVSGLDNNEAF